MGNRFSHAAATTYIQCQDKKMCQSDGRISFLQDRRDSLMSHIRNATSVSGLESNLYGGGPSDAEFDRQKQRAVILKKWHNNLPGYKKELIREMVQEEQKELSKIRRDKAECARAKSVPGLFPKDSDCRRVGHTKNSEALRLFHYGTLQAASKAHAKKMKRLGLRHSTTAYYP